MVCKMKQIKDLENEIWAACTDYLRASDSNVRRADVTATLAMLLGQVIAYSCKDPENIEKIIAGLEGAIYQEAVDTHNELAKRRA